MQMAIYAAVIEEVDRSIGLYKGRSVRSDDSLSAGDGI